MARHRPDAMHEMGRFFHSMEAALADDQIQLALDLVARFTEVAKDKYRTEDVAVLLKTELAPLLGPRGTGLKRATKAQRRSIVVESRSRNRTTVR